MFYFSLLIVADRFVLIYCNDTWYNNVVIGCDYIYYQVPWYSCFILIFIFFIFIYWVTTRLLYHTARVHSLFYLTILHFFSAIFLPKIKRTLFRRLLIIVQTCWIKYTPKDKVVNFNKRIIFTGGTKRSSWLWKPHGREYWMIYRGPGFLRSHDSAPRPPLPPHPSVFLYVAGWAY